MNIALDYDGTYTEDPVMWADFIKMAKNRGHRVYIVTCRSNKNPVDKIAEDLVNKVFYTNYQAKRAYMIDMQKIRVDVWIDDNPEVV